MAGSDQYRDRKGAASGRLSGDPPLAYFLTFRCYGTWLHGDPRGSMDRVNNAFGAPLIPPDRQRVTRERSLLRHHPLTLEPEMRAAAAAAVEGECTHRNWHLYALNVRTNHVHAVVAGDQSPERIMTTLKSWTTTAMVEAGLVPKGLKVWSRHGSTKYLWDERARADACTHVMHGQGGAADE